MIKVNAILSYELIVTCPSCDHSFDVINNDNSDDVGVYSRPLFNNKWESLSVNETCPKCDHEFIVSSIEY